MDTGKMGSVVMMRSSALLAEQRGIESLFDSESTDFDPSHYLGATGAVIDRILARARAGQEHS